MEQITASISGPKVENNRIINQNIEVLENENYYSALVRSLKKIQNDSNALLTKVIEEDKKRVQGKSY